MNQFHRIFGMGVLSISLLLAGCGQGQGLEGAYPAKERMEELVLLLPGQYQRAEPFASGLCIVTEDDQAFDGGVDAEAAAVFSLADHQTILQKHALERLYPASMTKVMTALVAIRYGDLQEKVTVGQEAIITEEGATLCYIKPGDSLTLEQLLYGLMMPSGNDAGATIAVHMAGSIEGFADMMNREAWAIGATDSHFVNPHGLHDVQHYTTAYDMYLIFQEALKEPMFRKVIGTDVYTADYVDGQGQPKTQTWKNSNQYITGQQPMPEGLIAIGGKTGTTRAAGSCLIMGSKDGQGKEYVSVVMKAENRQKLYEDMTNIIRKVAN